MCLRAGQEDGQEDGHGSAGIALHMSQVLRAGSALSQSLHHPCIYKGETAHHGHADLTMARLLTTQRMKFCYDLWKGRRKNEMRLYEA